MHFVYSRTIRFADTDAAGVVYFANYLSICHEAYEESLREAGLELQRFFRDEGIVIPIAESECKYLRPLQCGDRVEVEVSARRIQESEFVLQHKVCLVGPPRKLAAQAQTRHVCIDSGTRRRRPLPGHLSAWIEAG